MPTKRKETQRPIYVSEQEYQLIKAAIAYKWDPLKKQGIEPNFSAVGLAAFRGIMAGKVKITDLVAGK